MLTGNYLPLIPILVTPSSKIGLFISNPAVSVHVLQRGQRSGTLSCADMLTSVILARSICEYEAPPFLFCMAPGRSHPGLFLTLSSIASKTNGPLILYTSIKLTTTIIHHVCIDWVVCVRCQF